MCGSRGGGGQAENSQNIGILSNTGPDPLQNHKATKPAFNVGPAKHHLNGVSLAGRWWADFSSIWREKKLDPLWKNFLDPHMSSLGGIFLLFKFWFCKQTVATLFVRLRILIWATVYMSYKQDTRLSLMCHVHFLASRPPRATPNTKTTHGLSWSERSLWS